MSLPHESQTAESGGDSFPIIEGYEVVDLIGRGGMGAVYEAFQQSTGRRVAVKLMLERAGETETARRRFEREVELVARLNHPNIVNVLDSGLHRGRYYYVMEYVEGRTLDVALPPGLCEVRDAVGAMAKVARAVDYAHQRGVMHRDLKPTNIVVDQRGEPQLLDFGLAKAFDPHSMVNLRQSLSEPGQVIGTLGYMSPEQARGAVGEVSVRSDVYALGAITYELITGRLACPIEGAMALVFQRIESRDPERPSQLRSGVAADLDAVLLKSLEKTPAKRYATAGELADELERWLDGRSVQARRVSTVMRGARWCRRNPALAGVMVAVAALALVLMGSAWLSSKQRAEREHALAMRDAADNKLLDTAFRFDPDNKPGSAESARISLEEVESSLREAERPARSEANMRERMGDLYRKLGDYDLALACHARALELREGILEAPNEEIARSLHALGAVHYDLRLYEEAVKLYRRALEMRRELSPGADHAAVADSMNHLAQTLGRMRQFKEAEPLQREVLEMRRRLFGEKNESTVAAINNYATLLSLKGEHARAEEQFRLAKDLFIEIRKGDRHRYVARSMRNIAGCMMEQGKLEGVEEMLRQSEAISSEVLETHHPEAAEARHDLAKLYLMQGRMEEAERLCRAAMSDRVAAFGEEHSDVQASRLLLGRILAESAREEEAETEIRGVLKERRRSTSANELDLADAEAELGAVLLRRGGGAEDEGLALLRSALPVLAEERGCKDRITRMCAEKLAAVLRQRGAHDEADAVIARLTPTP